MILIFNEAGESVFVESIAVREETAAEVADVHCVEFARCHVTLTVGGDAA